METPLPFPFHHTWACKCKQEGAADLFLLCELLNLALEVGLPLLELHLKHLLVALQQGQHC